MRMDCKYASSKSMTDTEISRVESTRGIGDAELADVRRQAVDAPFGGATGKGPREGLRS
jgi:hypothetical protein